jgi:hypothetical protein
MTGLHQKSCSISLCGSQASLFSGVNNSKLPETATISDAFAMVLWAANTHHDDGHACLHQLGRHQSAESIDTGRKPVVK